MFSAIIPAAGSSRRMQSKINKQFMTIAGQPVLTRSLLSLRDFAQELVVVSRAGEEDLCREAASPVGDVVVITGGATRQESVHNGLLKVKGEYVLVHDGNRPLASPELIARVIAAAMEEGAAIPAIPVVDTIKAVDAGFVVETLPRERLMAVQTPQIFRRDLLLKAYEFAKNNGIEATDDASLLEAMGHRVAIVEGERTNLKITTPEDIHRADQIFGAQPPSLRIGHGYDVHQLVEDRKLILGGIEVPFEKGLLGHSDADVLVHAIMDALLGAAALGDIGRHFPDTDPQWAGADSCRLLGRVAELLGELGMRPGNIDATIIAQRPKLSPYIKKMTENLAAVLDLDVSNINIKATTTESLGFTGRGEGIAAQSVCTVLVDNWRR